MDCRIHRSGRIRCAVRAGVREKQSAAARSHCPNSEREPKYAERWRAALSGIYVCLRDCIAVAAGGDHRRSGHGEEENLNSTRRSALGNQPAMSSGYSQQAVLFRDCLLSAECDELLAKWSQLRHFIT